MSRSGRTPADDLDAGAAGRDLADPARRGRVARRVMHRMTRETPSQSAATAAAARLCGRGQGSCAARLSTLRPSLQRHRGTARHSRRHATGPGPPRRCSFSGTSRTTCMRHLTQQSASRQRHAELGGSCYLCCVLSVTWRGGVTRSRASRLAAWPVLSRPGGTIAVYQALSRRASDVRGDDIGGVAVQGRASPVIAHSGSRNGVRSRFLHVPERHPGVGRCSDERVPQRVRPDRLGNTGAAGYLADDPGGTMAVQPPIVRSHEDRALAALANGQVDRPRGPRRERDGDHRVRLISSCGRRTWAAGE